MSEMYLDVDHHHHGTDAASADTICDGNIDVTLGGGELGVGFYTGQEYYLAERWARHIAKGRGPSVVRLSVPNEVTSVLSTRYLPAGHARRLRDWIRDQGKTQTHRFNVDVLQAPIVGRRELEHARQDKWESGTAQNALNGTRVGRTVKRTGR